MASSKPSPGLYLTIETDMATGRDLCYGKLIPEHGSWLDFETSSKDIIWVKVNGKRRFPVTTLLRAIGYPSTEELITLFQDVDNSPDHAFIAASAKQDSFIKSENEAILEIYRRLRPGDLPNIDNAKNLLNNLFFHPRHYNLGKVGRYKLNKRLGESPDTANLLAYRTAASLLAGDLTEWREGMRPFPRDRAHRDSKPAPHPAHPSAPR